MGPGTIQAAAKIRWGRISNGHLTPGALFRIKLFEESARYGIKLRELRNRAQDFTMWRKISGPIRN